MPYFAQTTLTNLSHITTLKRQQAVTKFKKGIKKSSNQAKRIEQKTNRDLEIPKLKHPTSVSIYIIVSKGVRKIERLPFEGGEGEVTRFAQEVCG